MLSDKLKSKMGQRISLTGQFDVPVVLEEARPLGSDDSAGYDCRVRLPDGSLEKAAISAEEVAAIIGRAPSEEKLQTPVAEEKLRLLIESARIRLAYAHDQQFAVSVSGIRQADKALESTRNRKRRELFDAQDVIDSQRDELIKQIEGQLRQRHAVKPVFFFRWRLA